MSPNAARLPGPALALSFIAVLIAIGGTAVAKGVLVNSPSQLKKGVVTGKQIRNGSVARADLAPSLISDLEGATGPAGPKGDKGDRGDAGPAGRAGPDRPDRADGPDRRDRADGSRRRHQRRPRDLQANVPFDSGNEGGVLRVQNSGNGQGILGRAESGVAVEGLNNSSLKAAVEGRNFGVLSGVYGHSAFGDGIVADSPNGNGVVGRSQSADDSGVFGQDLDGGHGSSASPGPSVRAARASPGSTTPPASASGSSARAVAASSGRAATEATASTASPVRTLPRPADQRTRRHVQRAGTKAALLIGDVGVNGKLSVAGPLTVTGELESPLATADTAPITVGAVVKNDCDGILGCLASAIGKFRSLTVIGAKNFEIEHPLDPGRKLRHAAIEGARHVHDLPGTGHDGRGRLRDGAHADWFDALNRDLEYQLTPIGSFSPAMVGASSRTGRGHCAQRSERVGLVAGHRRARRQLRAGASLRGRAHRRGGEARVP